MKEMKNNLQDYSDVIKGNGLIIGIILLNLIITISLNFNIHLKKLSLLNQYDVQMECLKIKVVQQLEKEFEKGTCIDFKIEENDYYCEVNFYGSEAHAYFYGDQTFTMIFTYDDVFLCIASVEYIYD